jgi:hypothetical protein
VAQVTEASKAYLAIDPEKRNPQNYLKGLATTAKQNYQALKKQNPNHMYQVVKGLRPLEAMLLAYTDPSFEHNIPTVDISLEAQQANKSIATTVACHMDVFYNALAKIDSQLITALKHLKP